MKHFPTSLPPNNYLFFSTAHAFIDKQKMASALRFGGVLRRGLCPSSVVARRRYSNGVDRIPLTFASPTQVRKWVITLRLGTNWIYSAWL